MDFKIGKMVQQPQGFKAFIPNPFPPGGIAELLSMPRVQETLNAATLQLGKLDGITEILPDLDFFIFMYVRKEAALSSEIEGTQATMIDAIRAEVELTSDLPKDVERITHYIDAMNSGLRRLQDLPLSIRLIKEVHGTLIEGTNDGFGKTPGEIRTSQNWIGGSSLANARYVPPPVDDMNRALSDLEKFLHSKEPCPRLVKAALAHAQFETIHPFLDGNGRTGRLLVTFYLCHESVLDKPVLYLSAFFQKHREAYFDLLNDYHQKGDIESWLLFFLDGVREVAAEAVKTSAAINSLRLKDMERIQLLGKQSKMGMVVLKELYKLPITSVAKVQEWTGLSRQAANTLVNRMTEIGILVQRDKNVKHGRQFSYEEYLNLFTE